ncbi:hypothetical protein [Maritalea porphyrae]|uniref:hypothetical protein n=1 Tax=Maritalea porphyrae TaxID=880732 RepID=UPI0022B0731F|nr:hypothetical protein [Maritalea porphyrae]MCZ4272473.1 hypothetical protein [Maritalea porphyrae]
MQFLSLIGGFFVSLLGGGLGPNLIKGLNQAYRDKLNAKTESERIAADGAIEFYQSRVAVLTNANAEGTNRQKFKMNHKVFWFILGAALLPGLSTFGLLAIYNVLWHANGIWPQSWGIAAFPQPYDEFSRMAMEWLFDPVKVALSTGTAAAGGFVTGKRT